MAPLRICSVILFYNKPKLTKKCLDSVFVAISNAKQISDIRHRIILVDNGSQGSALKEVQEYILNRSPGVIVDFVSLSPNQGFSKGMNAGLNRAFHDQQEVDFVCAFSNDVEVPLDFFENLASIPLSSGAFILCPQVYYLMDRTRLAYTYGSLDLATMTLMHHQSTDLNEVVFPQYYPAAATIWTPSAYQRLGGFDERFFCYWEDVSLSLWAKLKEVRLRLLPQLQIHHFGRGTTGGKSVYNQHFMKGRELLTRDLQERGFVP